MRRMISGPVLYLPNENNKVFCAQFVADELVANDIEPGYYCVIVVDTQHKIVYPNQIFRIVESEEYHGLSFMDINDYEVALRFNYNSDVKTLTFTMYGIGAISSSDYHIDMFRID